MPPNSSLSAAIRDGGSRNKPQRRHAGDGLARAGFAHNANAFARSHPQAHPAHRLHHAIVLRETDGQVFDIQQGHARLR